MSVKYMSNPTIGKPFNTNSNMSNPTQSYNTSSSFSSSVQHDYEFIPPPEAPVFYPTEEEFALGPLKYIAKIRAKAEPHGICKIIPPKSFQPPFAVAVDDFRFTPRIQRLNELEATTRIKLNFIEQLVKFWDLQGASFKIPNLERRALDLFTLHRIVKEEGGFETCTRERKWSKVATRMGYNSNAMNRGTIASLLRQHYERILYPYDVFQSGATIGPDIDEKINLSDEENVNEEKLTNDENGNESSEEKDSEKQNIHEKRCLRRQQQTSPPILLNSGNQSKELKKLQVYGAGPKMPGVLGLSSPTSEQSSPPKEASIKACLHCGESNSVPTLLTCDNCENTYHMMCLIPPLHDWPKGVWHCHRCLAQLVHSHPQPYTHEFGFVQSQRQYTLSEFSGMADQFKTDYFNMPHHTVPLSLVEKEFWRLVSSLEENVAVEYGADLHTNDYGSGFPTKLTKNILQSDLDYLNSPWNLNNLPILEGSVFRHINANINGMIIPWMYVGMCFATFCWHNEDHWTYSINYLHWGEAKTWYGVPGEHAETFERAMKRAAPELFQSQPDLLHQLVTICNPNILMQDGVPVYRTNQHAGEFVVTFPRAYHAGFNQGLNFAEAVNFAPSDWLPIGRVCVTHYAMLHRYPVFSHDELICKMANDPEHLEVNIAAETYRDMLRMVESEKSLRLSLLEWGVTHSEREAFELLPDDERQCDFCKTTCFLSALTCKCDQTKLVCVNHKDNLCQKCLPVEHTLRYRYTLDELPIMLERLKTRAKQFEDWASRIKNILKIEKETDDEDDSLEEHFVNEDDIQSRVTLKELRQSLNEAVSNKYPTNLKVYEQLHSVVNEATKCSRAARDLLRQQENYKKQQQFLHQASNPKENSNKRTLRSTSGRYANALNSEQINNKLTLEELTLFHEELNNLPCLVPETNQIKELVDYCNKIEKSILKVVENTESNDESNNEIIKSIELESLLVEAQSVVVIDFGSQLELLRHKYEESKWLEDVQNVLDEEVHNHELELSTIKNLIESGTKLAQNTDLINSKIYDLQQILDEANNWIEKTKTFLNIRNQKDDETVNRKPPIEILEVLLAEAEQNPNLKRLQLAPFIDKLNENVQNARIWMSKVDSLFGDKQNKSEGPMIDVVDELVAEANQIECQLEHLPNLNSTISAAKAWRDRLNRTFCKKNSLFSLLNVLIPRAQQSYSPLDITTCSTRSFFQFLKKNAVQSPNKDKKGNQKTWFESQLNGNYSRNSIVSLYKMLEEEEMTNYNFIRDRNKAKSDHLGAKLIDFDSESLTKDFAETQISTKRICLCTKDTNEKLDWLVQCNLCNEWFHLNCIQNCCNSNSRKKQVNQSQDLMHSQQHFLCVLCSRGRRPRLDQIQTLMYSLQKLPVRIFEGELLQCLAERVINWQDKVKKALNFRSDLANAYNRVIKSQNPFTNLKSEIESPIKFIHQTAFNYEVSPSKGGRMSDEQIDEKSTAEALLQLQRSQPAINLSQHPNDCVESTHSESTISASSPEPSLSNEFSPYKNKRKSPLVLRGDPPPKPLVDLSEDSRRILYELLLEGNCLEVSLDELTHLWSIWQLANPSIRTAIHYNSFTPEIPSLKHKRKLNLNDDSESPKKKINLKIKPAKVVKQTNKQKMSKKTKKDNDDVCSMKEKCVRPNVDQVNWVMCDSCEEWFHQLCLGIDSPDEVANVEQFFCAKCKQKKC